MEENRRESYVDAFLPDYIGIFCVDLLNDKVEVLENNGLLGSTTKGTVFRPPAVEPELPPISMKKREAPFPAGERLP